jgi:hypothetical protein
VATNGDVQNGAPYFWLKPGDAISFTSTGASGTESISLFAPSGAPFNPATDSRAKSSSRDTTLTISINANTAATFRARAYASISVFQRQRFGNQTFNYATFSSSVSCIFVYEEYNVIS